jgi:WhiB family redox-sensing transcriptional regulator
MARSVGAISVFAESAAELREDWMQSARCRMYPEVSFFPSRGEPPSKARAICARCPVKAECLEFALALGERLDGIWGGTSQFQRQQLLRSRRDAHAS